MPDFYKKIWQPPVIFLILSTIPLTVNGGRNWIAPSF